MLGWYRRHVKYLSNVIGGRQTRKRKLKGKWVGVGTGRKEGRSKDTFCKLFPTDASRQTRKLETERAVYPCRIFNRSSTAFTCMDGTMLTHRWWIFDPFAWKKYLRNRDEYSRNLSKSLCDVFFIIGEEIFFSEAIISITTDNNKFLPCFY